MHKLMLTEAEAAATERVLASVCRGAICPHRANHDSDFHSKNCGRPWAETEDFLKDAAIHAQELPLRLRTHLTEMKYLEVAGACVIAGIPVDDAAIGQTPEHWSHHTTPSPTLREELLFVLLGSLLGDVFGWATQQNGAIIHDILPIRGHEREQLGSGSEDLLLWHTEEAFHPYRCDYLGLMCLRNHDRVPTTFASMEMVALDQETLRVLFEPRFVIRPDTSHLAKHGLPCEREHKADRLLAAAYERINQMNRNPQKVAILYGDPESPYLSVDPYYMDLPGADREARRALNVLVQAIDANLQDIVLQPGECCFLDNYRTVHGRKPFKARYDGTDRWLKRINITRDLRKSRASRATSNSRVIY